MAKPEPTPRAPDPFPTFELGQEVPFTLRLCCDEGRDVPLVRVRLAYRCHGSGSPEIHEVALHEMEPVSLKAGIPSERSGVLLLPAQGPVSYSGEHVKFSWYLAVEPMPGISSGDRTPLLARAPRMGRK